MCKKITLAEKEEIIEKSDSIYEKLSEYREKMLEASVGGVLLTASGAFSVLSGVGLIAIPIFILTLGAGYKFYNNYENLLILSQEDHSNTHRLAASFRKEKSEREGTCYE